MEQFNGGQTLVAIKQANKHFWWNRNFLNNCNIHLIVSTYTRESIIKRIWNISTDQKRNSACGLKGKPYTAVI